MGLNVFLFVSGSGSKASSYKPNRQESQWWLRRDAWARCVASCIRCARIIFWFDEDSSWMTMECYEDHALCTEKALIEIWKEAAENPGKTIRKQGFICILHLPEFGTRDVRPALDTKRDVLEYLQKVCSLDFLRQEKLNSPPQVILRKTNRSSLLQSLHRWSNAKKNTNENESSLSNLQTTLMSILSPVKRNCIVAELHESKDGELALTEPMESESPMFIFLGAVRDMTKNEHSCLLRVCDRLKIPFVGVRLGPVPEFTSKILSIVALHHSHNRLRPALESAVSRQRSNKRPRNEHMIDSNMNDLYFFISTDLKAEEVTCDLDGRDLRIWRLVRSLVSALWRSRITGQKVDRSCVVKADATIVFADDVACAVSQEKFVSELSEQHQAAPTEYQILRAFSQCLKMQSQSTKEQPILFNAGKSSECILYVSSSGVDLVEEFHINGGCDRKAKKALTSLHVVVDRHGDMLQSTMELAKSSGISVVFGSISELFNDWEAGAIAFVQHLAYQGLLSALMDRIQQKTTTVE